MSENVLIAIIGAVGVIIASVSAAIISTYVLRSKKLKGFRLMESHENPCKDLGNVQRICMYSVNSYVLYNYVSTYLEQNPDIIVNRIIIIVRKRTNETQNDIFTLNQIIKNWRRLVESDRIKSLKIISTPHDINQYYAILGTKMVLMGLVYHDDELPSSTNVDYQPLLVTNDSKIGKELIEKYQKHFDHIVKKFENDYTLYDSTSSPVPPNK